MIAQAANSEKRSAAEPIECRGRKVMINAGGGGRCGAVALADRPRM